MALTEKLTAIADAIREKTNTTEKITLAKMPEMISSITGGGGAATEYVNFYDYDGSLLHQYPLPIFEKMAALPMHPGSRTDCECVGWNYDLETIKAMKSHVNVAAIYNQKDEEVETHTPGEPVYVDGTKLYMHFDYELKITLYFRQTIAQGVTVHWGDGESSVSGTGTGSTNLSLAHTFQAGDYVIRFEVAEGCILSLGQANTNYCVVGYVGSTNSTYVPAWNTLQKAEIDLRNTALLSSAFRMCLGLKEVIIGNGRSTAIPSYCFDYCQSLERVSLSDDISTIYEYAFRCCYRLRNITIPTSVTSIGSYAFLDCRKLHDISIPGTVKTLSSYAFQNCMALKSVHLGSGVQTLGSNLFYGCYHLVEINLPNTIKTLNSSVFLQCYALKELVFPTGITSIPSNICQSCYALKTVIIPEGIKQISSNAFNAAYALQFIGIPKSLTTIYDSAFLNCYAMRNVVLGMNVKEIRAGAFQGLYGLEYLILPPSVTTLGIRAFAYCRCLKNLVVPSTLQSVTGGIIACEIPSAQIDSYYRSLLENATEIRESAFDTNRTLESAAVPEDITAIGTSAFQYIYCLKKAALPIGLLTIGTNAFRNDFQLGTVAFPVTLTAIDQNAFEQCFGVEEAVLPGSVRSINGSAFLNCYGLRELEIRGNSMVLNGSAFSGCYSLRQLRFSPGVTAISLSGSVFTNTGLEVLRNLPQKVTFTGSSTFNACSCLEEVDLSGGASVDSSTGSNMFQSCYALDKIVLPESMTAVGTSMFQSCLALKQITLGSYVNTIYNSAFYECRNLETVEFTGNMLTSIQYNAFYYCWQLKEIRIPYSVTNMAQCFSNCMALHDVYMYPQTAPTGTTNLGAMASGYIIHVPKGYLESYEKQWTGHAGHFQEFVYMIASRTALQKNIRLQDTSVVLKNTFIHTAFDEGQTFTVSAVYNGTNLAQIKDFSFDYENSTVSFSFERAETIDYERIEEMVIRIDADGLDLSCEFTLRLRFLNAEVVSEYTVLNPAGYAFAAVSDDFYESSNKGKQSSYALARVNVTCYTGKFYVDIIGGGEANYDYGLVSNLDCELSASSNPDSGSVVRANYYGRGSYTETLEYTVEDNDEHFIYLKYRKDGSVDSGIDCMRFRIRFED